MRAISQYTNHVIQIRPQRQRPLGDGTINVTQEPLYAVFTPVEGGGFIFENEKEAAAKHFSFHGLTQHEDEATPSEPDYRLSVYDTDAEAEKHGWDAETKAEVEAVLVRKAQTAPQNILLVKTTPIPAPYPAYDSYVGDAEQLVYKLVEDGHDIPTVLHYEREFGPKRPDVIEALEVAAEALGAVTVTA